MLKSLAGWWAAMSPMDVTFLAIGLFGQIMFSARWILQWIASERVRQSTVPALFWYLSFLGSIMVLTYGVYRRDPVIIAGQFGFIIYARNLFFLHKVGREVDSVPPRPDQSTLSVANMTTVNMTNPVNAPARSA